MMSSVLLAVVQLLSTAHAQTLDVFPATCPGQVTLQVSDATPGGQIAFVTGTGLGGTQIPNGGCAGTELFLSSPTLRTTRTADANGSVTLSPNLPAGVCGQYLQVVDLSACAASGARQIGAPGRLLEYWLPLDGDGRNVAGTGLDGVPLGNPTAASDLNGNVGRALTFDGFDDGLVVSGATLPTGSAPRTVTAWMRPAPTSDTWGAVHWGDGDCFGRMFGIGQNAVSVFWGGCADLTSQTTVRDGGWHFVAATYDGASGGTRLYTDGQTVTGTVGLNTPGSELYIGAETTNNGFNFRDHFQGELDDVRVYALELSLAELDVLYALGPS